MDRSFDILAYGQRREQGSALEHHPCTALNTGASVGIVHVAAEYFDFAAVGPLQTEDRVQEHRFSGSRSANQAEDLPLPHFKVEPVMHEMFAKGAAQVGDPDRRGLSIGARHMLSSM